jgi:hypothetical protein
MSFGSDFSAVDDLDQFLTFLEGETNERTAFMQAIARRFTTQRYALFYDQTYGLDLRLFLSDSIPAVTVEGLICMEARKDERVRDCAASINVFGDTWEVSIIVTAVDSDEFTLTISVDAVSATLLSAE